MLKFLLFISMLNKSVLIPYQSVDKIYSYQSNSNEKKITFEFDFDYSSLYEIYVNIDLYDKGNNFINRYSNSLLITGNTIKSAIINHKFEDDFYVLISIVCDEKSIAKNARINFYNQDDCYINEDNRTCFRYYKSEYIDGVTREYNLDFVVNKSIFNKYLTMNMLDVNTIKFHTNYSFDNSESYLIIKKEIEEYDLYYDNGYYFLLNINNNYNFELLGELYIDLLNFKVSEEYFENSNKTNLIHFPFHSEVEEYECVIVIKSFVNIRIDFIIYNSGYLFGECEESKFCLERFRYD